MTTMISFSSEDSLSLAGWLMDEVARGLVPVWPSTQKYAERLVEGLVAKHGMDRQGVVRVLATAPRHGSLDWEALLEPVRDLEAIRQLEDWRDLFRK